MQPFYLLYANRFANLRNAYSVVHADDWNGALLKVKETRGMGNILELVDQHKFGGVKGLGLIEVPLDTKGKQ